MFCLTLQAKPYTVFDIQPSIDPTGRPLPTKAEYLSRFPEYPLQIYGIERFSNTPRHPRRDETGTILLLINQQLYGRLQEEFELFTNDLLFDGYDVVRLSIEGGTPAELKTLIIEEGSDSLVGIILCGELALAWFEQYHYFRNEHEPDNLRLNEYPIDLYFMDLDGEWQDTSSNGIYDIHTGNWEPDIFLGRIAGYNLSRIAEDTLVASYLRRVHAYRLGELNLPHRAIAFIDDDWQIVSNQWANNIALAWGKVDCVAEPESTSAANYRLYLCSGAELMQVGVHSSTDSHAFLVERRSRYDYFRFRELREGITPNVFFYNLFACSIMNLTSNLCLGALYALKGPYGLGSVGPTKRGGMLFYEDYYCHLYAGLPFGEALRLWFIQHGQEPGHENWARSWFYGMTYFGDPTLKLRFGLDIVDYQIDDRNGGDGDERIDAGETIELNLTIRNRSENPFRGVSAKISETDPYLTILIDSLYLGDINANSRILTRGIRLYIHPSAPDNHSFNLSACLENQANDVWWDNIGLTVFSPAIIPIDWITTEISGDSDGLVEPNEIGGLSIILQNTGGDDMNEPGLLCLETPEEHLFFESDTLPFQPINMGSIAQTGLVQYTIPDSLPPNISNILIHIKTYTSDILRGDGMLLLPCRSEFSFEDDFNSSPTWARTYNVKEGFRNVWRWVEDLGNGSGGIAFGGPDTISYPPLSDGAFELPLMRLAEDAILEIYHRLNAEAEYDAAVVEVNRGMGWQRVEPMEGYNGVSVDNGSFTGGPCWNGVFDWRTDRIQLDGPAGALKIRLRFASDGGVENDGWYIDRLSVNGSLASTPISTNITKKMNLIKVYPNPFNDYLIIQFDNLFLTNGMKLYIYDVKGRTVYSMTNNEIKFYISNDKSISLKSTPFPAGVYFLHILYYKDSYTQKIVLLK